MEILNSIDVYCKSVCLCMSVIEYCSTNRATLNTRFEPYNIQERATERERGSANKTGPISQCLYVLVLV